MKTMKIRRRAFVVPLMMILALFLIAAPAFCSIRLLTVAEKARIVGGLCYDCSDCGATDTSCGGTGNCGKVGASCDDSQMVESLHQFCHEVSSGGLLGGCTGLGAYDCAWVAKCSCDLIPGGGGWRCIPAWYVEKSTYEKSPCW